MRHFSEMKIIYRKISYILVTKINIKNIQILLNIFFDYNPSTSEENWVNRKSQKLEKIVKTEKFCEMLLLVVVLIHPKFFSRAIFVNNLHIPPHTQLSLHSIQHQEDLTKRSPKKFFNKIMFFVVESPIELFYVHSLKNVPSL